jgi:hypothetical protein
VYHTAAEFSKKPKEAQTAILLTIAGPEAIDIFRTFTYGEGEDANNKKTVLHNFKKHCQPHRNSVRAAQVSDERTIGKRKNGLVPHRSSNESRVM